MEKILVSMIPGVAFACTFFLLLLSLIQFRIYWSKGYQRSKFLSLFCFFAALFACEHFIAQSRAFSPSFTHHYVAISTPALFLSMVCYMRSMSFFVAVPRWIYKTYVWGAGGLAVAALVASGWYFVTGESWFFNPENILETDNYFVNSYSTRFGNPQSFINVALSISSVLTTVASLVLLRLVWKSSRDAYFVGGLVFSLIAALFENFLLPFTYAYFFPVVFMSNLFEAFRMNSLSYREYMREKAAQRKGFQAEQEAEKYQNSNLTEERIAELANKLKRALDEDKVFLNPNLNSEDLAKKIGIPAYQLSQVVNIGLNTTFFELISQHRIEEVKKRLQSDEYKDETIINIAYGVGFNSKSAFNTAFKKITGQTPSAFRKSPETSH